MKTLCVYNLVAVQFTCHIYMNGVRQIVSHVNECKVYDTYQYDIYQTSDEDDKPSPSTCSFLVYMYTNNVNSCTEAISHHNAAQAMFFLLEQRLPHAFSLTANHLMVQLWRVLSTLVCSYCHHQHTIVCMSAYLFITLSMFIYLL